MNDPTPLPTSRRSYTPPRLRVYGSLQEVTLTSNFTNGMNDMNASKLKTGF